MLISYDDFNQIIKSEDDIMIQDEEAVELVRGILLELDYLEDEAGDFVKLPKSEFAQRTKDIICNQVTQLKQCLAGLANTYKHDSLVLDIKKTIKEKTITS